MIFAATYVRFELAVPFWIVFNGPTATAIPDTLEMNPNWHYCCVVESNDSTIDGIHHLETKACLVDKQTYQGHNQNIDGLLQCYSRFEVNMEYLEKSHSKVNQFFTWK